MNDGYHEGLPAFQHSRLDHPCGVSNHNAPWRDVLKDNAARPYDRSLADSHTRPNERSCCDPNVVFELDGLSNQRICWIRIVMRPAAQINVLRNNHAISDMHIRQIVYVNAM